MKGPTSQPCEQCDSCVALAANGPGTLDVIEMDAATHGLVDDARELRERAMFVPAQSRYKIYIIDEAHQLGPGAANALLKLIEEPPSMCGSCSQRLNRTRSSAPFAAGPITTPSGWFRSGLWPPIWPGCARPKVFRPNRPPLALVARAGEGSVRDAMSILGQLVSGTGPQGLTYEEAVQQLGVTDSALLDDVTAAIAAGDVSTLFVRIGDVVDSVTTRAASSPTCWNGSATCWSYKCSVWTKRHSWSTCRRTDCPNWSRWPKASAGPNSTASPMHSLKLCPNCVVPPLPGCTWNCSCPRCACLRALPIRWTCWPASTVSSTVWTRSPGGWQRHRSPLDATGATAAANPETSGSIACSGANSPAHETHPSGRRRRGPCASRTAAVPIATEPFGVTADSRPTPAPSSAAEQQPQATPSAPPRDVPLDKLIALWPRVLDRVKLNSRVAWLLVRDCQPVSISSSILTLTQSNGGAVAAFTQGGHAERVRQAILDEMHLDLTVEMTLGGDALPPACTPCSGRRDRARDHRRCARRRRRGSRGNRGVRPGTAAKGTRGRKIAEFDTE